MTTEDLILGHFDGTLTSEQEALLQAELHASPEIRSLYEQHRSLHSMLGADVASLAPSARLDEAVVAAALGAVPEVIGGSAVSWLTSKMVVGISAALVGGLSIVILAGSGSEKTPVPADVPDPVVRTVPAAPAPAAPVLVEESKSDEGNPIAEPSMKAPAAKDPAAKTPSAAAHRTERAGEQKATTSDKLKKLRLGGEDETVIDDRTIKTKQDEK